MNKLISALNKSPINYFSDLFIVVMVLGWVLTIPILCGFAIYATIVLQEIGMWAYLVELIGIPLSAGGAIWMIKNGVQHAIASNNNTVCKSDFPSVEVDDDLDEDEVG